jgi:hypothetical protein
MTNRSLWIVLALVLGAPLPVFAQIDCGEFENSNTSKQYGQYNWLEYIVETRRPINFLCIQWYVAVTAYVDGVQGSGTSKSDLYTASVRRQIPVDYYGTWKTTGEHWRILVGFWYSNGSTASYAEVRAPAEEPPAEEAPPDECPEGEMADIEVGCGPEYMTPIIVDAARNGYHLSSAAEGVHFDLDADGAPELTAWTRADSDDAFLAMDRNGNGRIDDGSELFGNRTPAHRADVTALNGFEALEFLHAPSYGPSTLDQQIDARDMAFGQLLLWRDANQNGISEPDELMPLGAAGVRAIGTSYREKKRVDRFGNQFRQQGRIVWADGEGPVYDVWLGRGQ